MTEFRAGDLVEPIARGGYPLSRGKGPFKILRIDKVCGRAAFLFLDDAKGGGWFPHRFRLVQRSGHTFQIRPKSL